MTHELGERGQATIQFAAIFPIALFVILLCLKVYVAMSVTEQVNNAARNGARAASQDHELSSCWTKAQAALPQWLKEKDNPDDHLAGDRRNRVRITASGNPIGVISCRVEAKVPVLWRGIPLDFTVNRTVDMPG